MVIDLRYHGFDGKSSNKKFWTNLNDQEMANFACNELASVFLLLFTCVQINPIMS